MRLNEVKDIEIVAIPKTRNGKRDAKFCIQAVNIGSILKGKIIDGRYIQFWVKDKGIKLDLFLGTHQNYAMLKLIRTGCSEFSQSVLGCFNRLGFESKGNIPTRKETGVRIYFKNEEDIFKFIGYQYVKPKDRIEAIYKMSKCKREDLSITIDTPSITPTLF